MESGEPDTLLVEPKMRFSGLGLEMSLLTRWLMCKTRVGMSPARLIRLQ